MNGGRQSARRPFGSRLLGSENQSPRALRRRIQLLLTGLLVTANVIGAMVVLVISLIIPSEKPTSSTLVALAIAVPVYVAVAVLVGAVLGTTTAFDALRWATVGREPTAAERDRALKVPLRLTQLQASLWILATVLFTLLAVILQPARALTTGVTVAIAGIVVCAVAYLLAEFTLRPIAARALASQPLGTGMRGTRLGYRLVVFWLLGTAVPVLGLVLTAILTLAGASNTSKTSLAVIVLVISGVVLGFGLLVTVMNARAVVAPVLSLRDALHDVEQGDLDREVVVFDATELGLLQSGFNQMVVGLREREHIRDLFGRHVGQDVARAAAEGHVELGGTTVEVSVIFVDLIGSTAFATERSPQEVVAVLNRFFGVVVDEIDARLGLVNKFVGDAALAVFGAPVAHADHAGAALAAARAIARRLREEVPEIGAGLGVATGEAVAGNIGHHSRFEYTVIGDAVNSAARLTDLAKNAEGGVVATMASVSAADQTEAKFWEPGEPTVLRGRSEPTELAVLAQHRGVPMLEPT